MVEHTGTSSGFLRTKISLKGNQSQLSLVSPFYGMKPELPPSSQLLGSEDLISLLDLNGSYNRYCGPKKPKEDLASFLPHVCGATQINKKADASCSLRQLIEKPPVMGKEINNLTAGQMTGFKLAPGPVPDGYRYFDLTNIPIELATTSVIQQQQQSVIDPNLQKDNGTEIRYGTRVKRSLDELDVLDGERKFKKHKGDDKEKSEKKKRKKDKKKKKEKDREKKNDETRLHVKKEPTTLASSVVTPFF